MHTNDSNGKNKKDSSNLKENSFTTKEIVSYEKTSCIFCSEWFDSQTYTEHLIHCRYMMDICPNGCKEHIPRMKLRDHLKHCKAATDAEHSVDLSDDQLEEGNVQMRIIVTEIKTFRTILNEEIRQRLHLITDVGNVRRQHLEQWERIQRIEKHIHYLWKKIDKDPNKKSITSNSSNQKEPNSEVDELDLQLDKIDNIQQFCNKNLNKLATNLQEFQETTCNRFLELDSHLNGSIQEMRREHTKIEEKYQKIGALDLEVKNTKQSICEMEDRVNKLESLAGSIEKKCHLLQQQLTDFENHLASNQRLTSILNTKGHLIWRINNFSKRFEEAKSYDTIVRSPMFSNKPFGYTLRLDVYLNGRGSWKGRNILACLNVMTGEYDNLLEWPCCLQANIIIRNQSNPNETSKDYVKNIHVRRKSEETLQSNQFFHIPHKIIMQPEFLKDDSIFIEVRIKGRENKH